VTGDLEVASVAIRTYQYVTVLSRRSLVAIAALIAMVSVVRGVAADPRLRVLVAPAEVVIDARETPVLEVVRALGERANFTVVELTPTRRPITIVLRAASVEQALREVLRAENHVVLYRPGAGGEEAIDTIVLLGAMMAGPPPPVPGAPAQASGRTGPNAADAVRSRTNDAHAVGERDRIASLPRPSARGGDTPSGARDASEDVDRGDVTVGDLLRMQASHGIGESPALQANTETPIETRPVSAEDSLAVLVQRAQQNLKALVDGLSIATESLQRSQSR